MEGILLSHRRASLVARSPHSLRSIGWRGIQDQERDGRARQFYGALALRIRLVADLLAGGNLPHIRLADSTDLIALSDMNFQLCIACGQHDLRETTGADGWQ